MSLREPPTLIDDEKMSEFIIQTRYVYFIEGMGTNLIKIGTSENPERRLKELQYSSPSKLRLITKIRGDTSKEAELHCKFAKYRKHGEWFEKNVELLDFIINILMEQRKNG